MSRKRRLVPIMKIKLVKKALVLIPAVLILPILASAAPTQVCAATGTSGNLNTNGSVTLSEPPSEATLEIATFTCPGLSIGSGMAFMGGSSLSNFSDFVQWSTSAGQAFIVFISADVSPTGPEHPVVITGTFTGSSGPQPITLTFSSDGDPTPTGAASDTVSASVTPEPSSMLLFGTGLLIAGGFVRRRFLSAKPSA
jgi:hypothetical protein